MQHASTRDWYLLLCLYIKKNYLLLLSIPFFLFFFYTFLNSGIDKSTEWSTIAACPSLMCFYNRGDTEGTKSSKLLCSMFVYVLFYVHLCTGLILWFLNNLWFGDLRAE